MTLNLRMACARAFRSMRWFGRDNNERTNQMHYRNGREAKNGDIIVQLDTMNEGKVVALTYAELEAVLQNCRWGIESAPGEDPPDGYETLPPEQAEIADACWHRGMKQLSTALLNYWYDHGAAPVSPNDPSSPTGGKQKETA